VGGKYDQFIGMIQEKYGYTREHIEEEVDRWTAKHEAPKETVAVPTA
jgi:uncharacterized protein YjbJ (UPF0337 family)